MNLVHIATLLVLAAGTGEAPAPAKDADAAAATESTPPEGTKAGDPGSSTAPSSPSTTAGTGAAPQAWPSLDGEAAAGKATPAADPAAPAKSTAAPAVQASGPRKDAPSPMPKVWFGVRHGLMAAGVVAALLQGVVMLVAVPVLFFIPSTPVDDQVPQAWRRSGAILLLVGVAPASLAFAVLGVAAIAISAWRDWGSVFG